MLTLRMHSVSEVVSDAPSSVVEVVFVVVVVVASVMMLVVMKVVSSRSDGQVRPHSSLCQLRGAGGEALDRS